MFPIDRTERTTTQLDRGGRYEHELLFGMAAPFHLGYPYRLRAQLTLETSGHSSRPFVDLGLTTPETELPSLSRYDLIGDQSDPDDPTGRPGGRRPVEPSIELPANPVGHRGGTESSLMTPEPYQFFAVLGLGFDRDPGAGHPFMLQPCVQLLSQHASTEGNPIDAIGRWVDLGRD